MNWFWIWQGFVVVVLLLSIVVHLGAAAQRRHLAKDCGCGWEWVPDHQRPSHRRFIDNSYEED